MFVSEGSALNWLPVPSKQSINLLGPSDFFAVVVS